MEAPGKDDLMALTVADLADEDAEKEAAAPAEDKPQEDEAK